MRIRGAFPILVLIVLAATRASATVFVPSDLRELVVAARAIAQGRIVDLRPRVSDDRRRVDTLVTLDVAAYLKGDLGSSVTFVVPGGQLGRYRTVVLDAPQFALGEEVVLLFGSRGPSIPYVLGLNHGVFRLQTDPTTAETRVVPAPLIGEGVNTTPIVRGDARRAPLTLSDFASQIRRVIAAEAAGAAR